MTLTPTELSVLARLGVPENALKENNMTERIDHAAKAHKMIAWGEEWMGEEGSTDATNLATALHTVAHATLALVEQQRIANLIALCGSDVEVHGIGQSVALHGLTVAEKIGTPERGFIRRHLNPDIAAALGIEEVQS